MRIAAPGGGGGIGGVVEWWSGGLTGLEINHMCQTPVCLFTATSFVFLSLDSIGSTNYSFYSSSGLLIFLLHQAWMMGR